MNRSTLAVFLAVTALLAVTDLTQGAARAFSKTGKDVAMKNFRSLNTGIQWDTWLVNLAGASTDCSDVGRSGPVTITKRSRTPDGASFAGFVGSTPGSQKDWDAVTKYIDTVISGWPSDYEIRSQIEKARKVGCAVRPGCRGSAVIVCVFSPAARGSESSPQVPPDPFRNPPVDPRYQPDPYRNPPVDPRYQPDPYRNPPVDPRYQSGGREQPDPRYNQPGRESPDSRYQPGGREQPDPRYTQPERPDVVDPWYQPGRREQPDDTYRIQPVDPRYQPGGREQPDDRYPAQPVDPRYSNQPGREQPDDRFRIQPVDPRYQPGDLSQPDDRYSIQPVDPRYGSQAGREQPDDRFSIQPVDPRYQPGGQPQPGNREQPEDTFRIQPVDPRYYNPQTGDRNRNQPPDQYESRGSRRQDVRPSQAQPNPYSEDRRTVNYPGGSVTFEKVDDPHAGQSHGSMTRQEMRRLRKEEKKRRRQQRERQEVDIYDRMISDGAMMSDDPNSQLGNMDQDEFRHYLRKYNRRHPQVPQHLKKADDTVIAGDFERAEKLKDDMRKTEEQQRENEEVMQKRKAELERQNISTDNQDNTAPLEEKPNVDLHKASDIAHGRNSDLRDLEPLEPLPQRLVISENPEPAVEPENLTDKMLGDEASKRQHQQRERIELDDISKNRRKRMYNVVNDRVQDPRLRAGQESPYPWEGLSERRDPRYYDQRRPDMRMLEMDRRRQAETARSRPAELDRRRQSETNRSWSENDRRRQAQIDRERQAEIDRQRQSEIERRKQVRLGPPETDRRRQSETDRSRQAEFDRRRQSGFDERRAEVERRRQADIYRRAESGNQTSYEQRLKEYYDKYPEARRRAETRDPPNPHFVDDSYLAHTPPTRRPLVRPAPVYIPTPLPCSRGGPCGRDPDPYPPPYPPRPVREQSSRLREVLSETPRAFTEEQRDEAEKILRRQWDRSHLLENLSGLEASCEMFEIRDWPFNKAQNEGRRRGLEVQGFFATSTNRGRTQEPLVDALRKIEPEARRAYGTQFGCSVIPDCRNRVTRMEVVVVCLIRIDPRPRAAPRPEARFPEPRRTS